jgi:hypothetical protein
MERVNMKKKFRAWHKINKEYEFFDFENIYGYEGEVCGVLLPSGEILNRNSGCGKGPLNKDLSIEQWTGMIDSQGTKIFEGDVFELTDRDGRVVCRRLARLDGETLSIDPRAIGRVLGNINENPTIL